MTVRSGLMTAGPTVAKNPSSRLDHRRRPASNTAILFVVVAIVTGVAAVILLSPLLLRALGTLGGANWSRLSEIGQAYGAASAILSALAVGGVAVSLFLQAGQARANQVQMVRDFQRELVMACLDNPDLYLPCWRPMPDRDMNGARQDLYTMLRLNYGQMGYEVGIITEASLRGDLLEGIFQGAVGRR